jgi:hypothetical protein
MRNVERLMNRNFRGAWRGSILRESTIAVCLLLVSSTGWGQGSQSGSLADIARQARAQKQSQSGDVSQAQQVAAELSEDQNDNAPGGFKTYSAPAYKVWVPAPYSLGGQDDGGTILSGPRFATTTPMVFVGNTIVLHSGADDAFNEAVTQFARHYAQSVTCTKSTIAEHAAYQCGLAEATLQGHSVGGNAVFVRVANNVYPLMCFATTDSRSRDLVNTPGINYNLKAHARQTLAQEEENVRQVWQRCDTVFGSIRLKDSAGAQPEVAQSAIPPAPAVTQQNDPPHAQKSTAPEGFKIHSFNYCKSASQCWDASLFIPSDAKLVSSNCKQYIFESNIQGTSFLLMAGTAGCEGGTPAANDLVRWKQLVDPENKRAPGTYSTISSQATTLGGKFAAITTLSFRKGLDDWMGKRVEVESNGVPLVVGCIAPREHFADGEAVCSTMIGSLQLP